MDFIAKCEFCGKEYDSYVRTFYIQYPGDNGDRKCCCLECRKGKMVLKPYRFINHVPTYVDGADIVARLFDYKTDLIEWLKKEYSRENEVLCYDEGLVMTLSKKEKFWWVLGHANLEKGDLPDWRETAAKYYGPDWNKR